MVDAIGVAMNFRDLADEQLVRGHSPDAVSGLAMLGLVGSGIPRADLIRNLRRTANILARAERAEQSRSRR